MHINILWLLVSLILIREARIYIPVAAYVTGKGNQNMNLEKQITSGSAATFADEMRRVCQIGILTPEEIKRQRMELKLAEEMNRILVVERYMAGLKEVTRRTLNGETADE